MFGYIKTAKGELKIKEYELYKAVYCTLCKESGRRYGFIARMTLSYDFTFLALLSLAQNETEPCAKKGRCVVNPLKKCSYICGGEGEAFRLAAAASAILLYYKLKDNKADEKGIKKLTYSLLYLMAGRGHKKAAADYPEIENIAAEYYAAQCAAEKGESVSVDMAAEPTAIMLGKLCCLTGAESSARVLQRMGYCLGKWIYLIDAAEDYPEDMKNGNFNPFGPEGADIKERSMPLLNNCFAEAAAAYQLLDIKRFGGILENILYLGLKNAQADILDKKEWKKNERSL